MVDREHVPTRDVVLTREGLRRLEQELENLKTTKRKELAEQIRDALNFGDAWENPEYEAAKNEQAFVEGRILTLEVLLRNARIIDDQHQERGVVGLGSRVRLLNLESGDTEEYVIVGSAEADPAQARISYRSPVAQAILGQPPGKRVTVRVPVGNLHYEIVAILPQAT